MRRSRLFGLCASVCACGVARGDAIMHVAAIPVQTTNWNKSVSIPKFDATLGILNRIVLKLDGGVEGTSRFESRDAATTLVTTMLSASVRLKRPDLSDLVVSTPAATTMDKVSSWDGVDDFGGASGRTHSGLSANDLEVAELLAPFSPADAAIFVGGAMDTVSLPVQAIGTSSGSGAGNLLMLFNTQASANIMVIYEYTVPEPATGAILGMGAVVLARRRRRAVRRASTPRRGWL